MYSVGAATIIGIIVLLWLGILTYFFWRERGYLRELFPKNEARDIRNKFAELIELVNKSDNKNQILNKNILGLRREGLDHLQRIEVLRYNPYDDTGGDQSFSIALLDGKLNGLILTSLHSRAGTRIYTKAIQAGASDLKLSKEEEQVLKKAIT